MELHFFEPEVYHTRRSILARSIQDGLIIFPANGEVGMNYTDNAYPFRQESSFLYFTGIDRPQLFLLIDSHSGESILMGDEATLMDIVWTGPSPSLHTLAEKSGIDRVISIAQGIQWIQSLIAKGITYHYLPTYRGDHLFTLAKLLNVSVETISAKYSKTLAKEVVNMREIKSPLELDQLRQAINLSGNMHRSMMTSAKEGMTEAQVMSIIKSECFNNNVELPYPAIVTINGQTLHNHSYSNTLKKGQLLLGDFAAESSMHYAGDITRTIPVAAQFDTFQKEIYGLVLATLQRSIHSIKHYVSYKDIHLNAAKTITEGLIQLGLVSGDVEELVHLGAHALFFPHGLGHALGLDVHDSEAIGEEYTGYDIGIERSAQFGLRSLRLAKPLKEGMVITVEPGIYFIPELISIWKTEKKFIDFIHYDKIEKILPFGGIRIEENVCVRQDHGEILGSPIPKEIEEIESLRSQAYQ